MTAWTVTQTSRFKAVAMMAGISNLISDAGTLDILDYERDYFGPPHRPLPGRAEPDKGYVGREIDWFKQYFPPYPTSK